MWFNIRPWNTTVIKSKVVMANATAAEAGSGQRAVHPSLFFTDAVPNILQIPIKSPKSEGWSRAQSRNNPQSVTACMLIQAGCSSIIF